jgi:hypothetical protein
MLVNCDRVFLPPFLMCIAMPRFAKPQDTSNAMHLSRPGPAHQMILTITQHARPAQIGCGFGTVSTLLPPRDLSPGNNIIVRTEGALRGETVILSRHFSRSRL